ncbi:LysR family transcriptional regulator [Luteimicrobium sp. NPDC057192]|uniref:LysR family transcriptional regulator n=1 Tax=Luteimicrobium sp. NPDC057192 TaxID=3346042 RepID=UPI00363C5B92
MELRQLRTFEAVLRHGTVTDAAVALGLAPSSVSEQVRALERSLGVALFARRPDGMHPTGAGERLSAWSRRILGDVEAARRDVATTPPAVRLGALETIAATYVPRVARRIAATRPGLDVALTSSVSRAALFDGVLGGTLDAALVLDTDGPLGELGYPVPAEALEHVDVEPVPLALVSAPGHPLAGAPALRPEDVRGERLLVNVPGCSFRYAGERLLGEHVDRVEAGGVPVLRAWAAQGLGLALLPEFAVADEVTAGRLVRLDLDVPALVLRLVFRTGSDADGDLRALLYAVVAPDTL